MIFFYLRNFIFHLDTLSCLAVMDSALECSSSVMKRVLQYSTSNVKQASSFFFSFLNA